jgi:hypothetical protein
VCPCRARTGSHPHGRIPVLARMYARTALPCVPSGTLTGTYPCSWQPYTTVTAENGRPVELRYLMIQVERQEQPPGAAAVPVAPMRPTPSLVSSPPHTPRASTARDEILLAVADILRRSGRDSFELGDVIAEMRRRDTSYAESTIRSRAATVRGVSWSRTSTNTRPANLPSSHAHPRNLPPGGADGGYRSSRCHGRRCGAGKTHRAADSDPASPSATSAAALPSERRLDEWPTADLGSRAS